MGLVIPTGVGEGAFLAQRQRRIGTFNEYVQCVCVCDIIRDCRAGSEKVESRELTLTPDLRGAGPWIQPACGRYGI